MKRRFIEHQFVDEIPADLEDGVVYVSIKYGTVVHSCCCGCRNEVVTPLSPTDWRLTFDGRSISLHPSIGNWSFACQSHYWIRQSQIQWARQWSKEEIGAGRAQDRQTKRIYFDEGVSSTGSASPDNRDEGGLWRRLKNWLSGR